MHNLNYVRCNSCATFIYVCIKNHPKTWGQNFEILKSHSSWYWLPQKTMRQLVWQKPSKKEKKTLYWDKLKTCQVKARKRAALYWELHSVVVLSFGSAECWYWYSTSSSFSSFLSRVSGHFGFFWYVTASLNNTPIFSHDELLSEEKLHQKEPRNNIKTSCYLRNLLDPTHNALYQIFFSPSLKLYRFFISITFAFLRFFIFDSIMILSG